MTGNGSDDIVGELKNFINEEFYPCVAARAALSRNHIPCLVVGHMGCPKDDAKILEFIYKFVGEYRSATNPFHSAAVIFEQPVIITNEVFETFFWQRLQSLLQMDSQQFRYDGRVSSDPNSADFSFSLGEEAFFVIGLHPASERRARRFKYPAIVFNPHAQFEQLRAENRYDKMKQVVRKRDILYSGSINPMLADFGEASEVYQYSGNKYDKDWTCPLNITHARNENHSTEKRRLPNDDEG